jgi:hypothetical protein
MTTTRFALIALTLTAAAASSGIAFATDMGGMTRAQVHAELLQAQRNGTLIANNMSGATLRDLYPSRYPAAKTSSLTREQVRAELDAARRNGTLIANEMSGATFRDQNPSRFPPKAMAPVASRSDVLRELTQAQRDGTLIANSQTGATYRDLNPGQYPSTVTTDAPMLGMAPASGTTRMN